MTVKFVGWHSVSKDCCWVEACLHFRALRILLVNFHEERRKINNICHDNTYLGMDGFST